MNYEKAIKKALYTEAIDEYGKKGKVLDYTELTEHSLVFIAFYYKEEEIYTFYKKPYIKMCMDSWKKVYPDSIILYIKVEKDISEWTNMSIYYGKKNYPTDSLRLLYASLFKKCFYLDVDVFLSKPIPIRETNDWPQVMVVNYCSGTCLYSANRNSFALVEWYNWYENEAIHLAIKNIRSGKDAFVGLGDIDAYHRFPRVPNVNMIMNHFSAIYPYIRDKKPFKITFEKTKDTMVIFDKEAYPAFMEYIKDKKVEYLIDPTSELEVVFTA